MQSYKLYKHENCTDTAIFVLKSYWIPEKNGYKVKVRWQNTARERQEPMDMNIIETIFIKRDDLTNWKVFGSI